MYRDLFEILSQRMDEVGGALEFEDSECNTALLPGVLELHRAGKLDFEMTVYGYVVRPGPNY